MDTGVEIKNGQPILAIPDAAAWEQWLAANHGQPDGVWLKFAKKSAPTTTVTYLQAVEEALCYGWIDGQAAAYDGHHWVQRFTPRRARSAWSQINRERVAALIEAGRMRLPGQAEVDRAKADGRWEAAYEPPSQATVPADLQAALDGDTDAAAFWATLDKQNRYAVTYRVQQAKRPETRARRIAHFVAMLARGEKLHP